MSWIRKDYPIIHMKGMNSTLFDTNLIPNKLSIIPDNINDLTVQEYIDYVNNKLHANKNAMTTSNTTKGNNGISPHFGTGYNNDVSYLSNNSLSIPLSYKPTKMHIQLYKNSNTITNGIGININNNIYGVFRIVSTGTSTNTIYKKNTDDTTAYVVNTFPTATSTTGVAYTLETVIPLSQLPFIEGSTYLNIYPCNYIQWSVGGTAATGRVYYQKLDVYF